MDFGKCSCTHNVFSINELYYLYRRPHSSVGRQKISSFTHKSSKYKQYCSSRKTKVVHCAPLKQLFFFKGTVGVVHRQTVGVCLKYFRVRRLVAWSRASDRSHAAWSTFSSLFTGPFKPSNDICSERRSKLRSVTSKHG